MIMVQEMNMSRKVFVLVCFMVAMVSCPEITEDTYVDKCPKNNAWKNADRICSSKSEGYHCTETILNNNIVYASYCSIPIQIRAGHYPWSERVGKKLDLTSKPCPGERYSVYHKPMQSNTVGFFQCELEKVKCNGIGQQKCTDGNTTTDRSCKCDYKRHFALKYINKRNEGMICCIGDHCDCREIKNQQCNWTTHELTENYFCKEKCKKGEKREPPKYHCVPGSENDTTSPFTVRSHPQTTPSNNDFPEENEKSQESISNSKIAAIVTGTVLGVLLLILVIGIVYCWKKKICCWKKRSPSDDARDTQANIERVPLTSDTTDLELTEQVREDSLVQRSGGPVQNDITAGPSDDARDTQANIERVPLTSDTTDLELTEQVREDSLVQRSGGPVQNDITAGPSDDARDTQANIERVPLTSDTTDLELTEQVREDSLVQRSGGPVQNDITAGPSDDARGTEANSERVPLTSDTTDSSIVAGNWMSKYDVRVVLDIIAWQLSSSDIGTIGTAMNINNSVMTTIKENALVNHEYKFQVLWHWFRNLESRGEGLKELIKILKDVDKQGIIQGNFKPPNITMDIPIRDPEAHFEDRDASVVSRQIDVSYIQLGRYLGLDEDKMKQISIDYPQIQEQAYQSLLYAKNAGILKTRKQIRDGLCYIQRKDIFTVLNDAWNNLQVTMQIIE